MSRSRMEGQNIHDILQMPVGEAVKFFANHRKFTDIRDVMCCRSRLHHSGQPATTLSGGEAQRVKLASELRNPY